MSKPIIKHNLNEYDMHNISYKNDIGIYKLTTDNDCYVKVYCDKEDLDSVESYINRHVDHVDTTVYVVGGTDKAYVIEGDESNYFSSWEEALLFLLDPEEELSSLSVYESKYKITSSSRPDDINNGSNTDRTQHNCKTLQEVVGYLYYRPYIHRLEGMFTKQEKEDLYKLSIRLQEKLGKPSETREVTL